MPLISKYNKRIRFFLCVIHIFSKYSWVVPLKDKKGITIVNVYKSILNNSNRKPKKYGSIKAVNFITRILING